MRREFTQALVRAAERDDRVVLLTSDLGYMVLEPFAARFPDRFINVGVAEQNMLGVATGLAEAGFIPFAYSIATFASMRPYEFLRNGPILHSLPVRLVGVGGGLDYGHNGMTHYALEDVALMRTQPELTVVVPADAEQAVAAVAATLDHPGPTYFRLEREGPTVPGLDGRFRLGRAEIVGDGHDVLLVAMGSCAGDAIDAAELLEAEDIHASVAIVSSFNPSPAEDIGALIDRAPLVLSVEAHYPTGALRSFVAEVIAARGCGCRLVAHAVDVMPRATTGSREFLFEQNGLMPSQLARSVTEALSLHTI